MDDTKLLLLADKLRRLRDRVDGLSAKQEEIQLKEGQQGPKGEQGDRGFDGAPGRDGDDGADGTDGQDGKDGVSVVNAEISFDGSLVIYLSDGREIDCGYVVRETGETVIQTLKQGADVSSGGGGITSITSTDGSVNITVAGSVVNLAVTPAGTNTQVQYNNSGSLGANANFTYDSGTNTLTTGNITGSALPMTIQPRAPTALENAGTLTLRGRDATAATRSGGSIVLTAGDSLTTGTPGEIFMTAGDAAGVAGGFTMAAGNGNAGGSFQLTSGSGGAEGGALFSMDGGINGVAGGSFAMGAGYGGNAAGGSFLMYLAGGITDDGYMEWQDSLGTPFMRFQTAAPGGAKQMAFFGATPVVKPTITGSRSGNAALASFLSGLNSLGLVTDNTTAGTAPSGSGQTAATIGPIPYNTQYAEVTVTDANISATSRINISWGNVTDADENTPDMSQVHFQAIPSAGSMRVRLACSDPLDRLGGLYKINYLIG